MLFWFSACKDFKDKQQDAQRSPSKNAIERISFSFSDSSRRSRKKMELNWTTQLRFVRGTDDWARGGTWHEGSTCPPRVCRGSAVYCMCVMMPNPRPVCCMTCISSDSFVCRHYGCWFPAIPLNVPSLIMVWAIARLVSAETLPE